MGFRRSTTCTVARWDSRQKAHGHLRAPQLIEGDTLVMPIFTSGRGVLACPKTELERNVLKWLWWHPGAYGWVGNYRGRELCGNQSVS